MFAFYAFARITDDLSDDSTQWQQSQQRLSAWRNQLDKHLSARTTGTNSELAGSSPSSLTDQSADATELSRFDRLWPALVATVTDFDIPVSLLHDLITGVQMDLVPTVQLSDWAAVDRYCYHVAGTVGLACTHIWQAKPSLPRQAALDCAMAFQYTNILRDLSEDAQRGRIYLPLTELQAHNCTSAAWLAGRPDGDWLGVVDRMIARARQCYDSAAATIDHLPQPGARMYWLMWTSYLALLDLVTQHKHQLWTVGRLSLPRSRTLGLIARTLWARHHAGGLRRSL